MNRNNSPVEIDHIDPRWKEGRYYQLVCGLDCPLNYREEDWKKNTAKSNRFLPWRWIRDEIGEVPCEPGDWAYFLVGADIETDSPGEWILMEFLSHEWFEASKGTLGLVALRHLRDDSAVVQKQWETLRNNPERLKARNNSVSAGVRKWRQENPEKAAENLQRAIEGNLRSRENEKEKWDNASQVISEKSRKMWEERYEELCQRVKEGNERFRVNNPEAYREHLIKLHEGKERWGKDNPDGFFKNLEKANVALETWRVENPDKVQEIAEAMSEGRERWMQTEDYQRYSEERSARMKELAKQKWQCVISSRISTAAGLSHIQKSLGIDHKDPNNRIRIN